MSPRRRLRVVPRERWTVACWCGWHTIQTTREWAQRCAEAHERDKEQHFAVIIRWRDGTPVLSG